MTGEEDDGRSRVAGLPAHAAGREDDAIGHQQNALRTRDLFPDGFLQVRRDRESRG
jgi:hypothetical protein